MLLLLRIWMFNANNLSLYELIMKYYATILQIIKYLRYTKKSLKLKFRNNEINALTVILVLHIVQYSRILFVKALNIFSD